MGALQHPKRGMCLKAIPQGRCRPRPLPLTACMVLRLPTVLYKCRAVSRTSFQRKKCIRQLLPCRATASSEGRAVAFPAGRKQAKVKLPACFVRLDPAALEREGTQEALNAAIGAGVTGILLTASQGSGAAFLLLSHIYEAFWHRDACSRRTHTQENIDLWVILVCLRAHKRENDCTGQPV